MVGFVFSLTSNEESNLLINEAENSVGVFGRKTFGSFDCCAPIVMCK